MYFTQYLRVRFLNDFLFRFVHRSYVYIYLYIIFLDRLRVLILFPKLVSMTLFKVDSNSLGFEFVRLFDVPRINSQTLSIT